jgi:hypothetical protein
MHGDDDMPNDATECNSEEGPLVWEGRVFAVAITWSLPGVLFGAMTGLLLPADYVFSCLVGGGSLGALCGGLLEAGYFDWGV